MITIGIDPGLTGAVGMLGHRGEGLAVADLPTMHRGTGTGAVKNQVNGTALTALLREWLSPYDRVAVTIVIELAQVMPAVKPTPGRGKGYQIIQGSSSLYSTGHSAGIIEGVVAALGYTHHLVPPSVWKKHQKLTATKEQARAFAIRCFPDLAASLARVKDHNRAESLLLGRYGYEVYA